MQQTLKIHMYCFSLEILLCMSFQFEQFLLIPWTFRFAFCGQIWCIHMHVCFLSLSLFLVCVLRESESMFICAYTVCTFIHKWVVCVCVCVCVCSQYFSVLSFPPYHYPIHSSQSLIWCQVTVIVIRIVGFCVIIRACHHLTQLWPLN